MIIDLLKRIALLLPLGIILLLSWIILIPLKKDSRLMNLKLKLGAMLVSLLVLSSQTIDDFEDTIFCYTPVPLIPESPVQMTGEFLGEIMLSSDKIITGHCPNAEYTYLFQILDSKDSRVLQEGTLFLQIDPDIAFDETPFKLRVNDSLKTGEYQLMIYHSSIRYENLLKSCTLIVE